jgi:hypothetical protein
MLPPGQCEQGSRMRRQKPPRFEELYWHDGLLERLSVSTPLSMKGKCALVLEVWLYPLDLKVPYPDQSVTKRVALKVTFNDVAKVEFTCDTPDLALNSIFGNINRLRSRMLRGGKRRIALGMFGAELSLTCKKIQVERR